MVCLLYTVIMKGSRESSRVSGVLLAVILSAVAIPALELATCEVKKNCEALTKTVRGKLKAGLYKDGSDIVNDLGKLDECLELFDEGHHYDEASATRETIKDLQVEIKQKLDTGKTEEKK